MTELSTRELWVSTVREPSTNFPPRYVTRVFPNEDNLAVMSVGKISKDTHYETEQAARKGHEKIVPYIQSLDQVK